MRNWACALEFNVELGLRQKSKELFPFHFSFLISHLSFLKLCPFSFVICHFKNFLICHFSFFFLRERERDPCIDAQQDDEQGLDGVDDQHEEQGIV